MATSWSWSRTGHSGYIPVLITTDPVSSAWARLRVHDKVAVYRCLAERLSFSRDDVTALVGRNRYLTRPLRTLSRHHERHHRGRLLSAALAAPPGGDLGAGAPAFSVDVDTGRLHRHRGVGPDAAQPGNEFALKATLCPRLDARWPVYSPTGPTVLTCSTTVLPRGCSSNVSAPGKARSSNGIRCS